MAYRDNDSVVLKGVNDRYEGLRNEMRIKAGHLDQFRKRVLEENAKRERALQRANKEIAQLRAGGNRRFDRQVFVMSILSGLAGLALGLVLAA